MNNYIVDTHAHLDMYDENIDVIVENAIQNGVKKIIIPGIEETSFQKIIDIASNNDNVFCQLGIFPSEAHRWNNDTREYIIKLAENKKVVAIGEIGLDYYWDKTFTDLQKKVFAEQIILANELNLPIVVHDREAHQDTINILKEHNKTSNIVFHCFSGSVEMMCECVKNGWYIALGGVVTFKNAKKMKDVAKEIPLEFLLLETDSPYLTPVPFRGKENQPAYTKYVAEEIAKIKNISLEEVIQTTTSNAERIFKI